MYDKIFEGIPLCVRRVIPAAIGLFNSYVGLTRSKIIVGDASVMTAAVDFTRVLSDDPRYEEAKTASRTALACLVTLLAICVLSHFRIRWAVVIGIVIGTIVSIPLGTAEIDVITGAVRPTWRFWENFANYFSWEKGVVLACFRGFDFKSGPSLATQTITLILLDIFDTFGAVIGCSAQAGLVDENGVPRTYGKIMYADALAAIASSLTGVTSVSVLIESATGVVAGGRTGLVPVVVAVLFVAALFLGPLFIFIPTGVSAAPMIYGGLAMIPGIVFVDFSDLREALPGWLTLVVTGCTSSIPKGLAFGTLSYVIVVVLEWVINLVIWVVKGRNTDEPLPDWPVGLPTIIATALFIFWLFLLPL
jgi:AGZA family xanthine/uracil permease-like MFS transporter